MSKELVERLRANPLWPTGASRSLTDEAADLIEQQAARIAELEGALNPFVGAFEKRRDGYSRRYKDRALGFKYFDKMPDNWPMESVVFTMGDYRRAASARGRT